MNKLQFTEYLRNPVNLGAATVPELKSLVETYPWFQTAQLLYAKALSNSNHVEYYSSLKKTSIVAVDRQMLYRLITQVKNISSFANEPVISQIQKTEEIKKSVDTKQENNKTAQIIESENPLPEIKLTSNTFTTFRSQDITFGNENFIPEKTEDKEEVTEEKNKRVELVITQREEISVKKEQQQEKIQEEGKTSDKKEQRIAPMIQAEEKNLDEIILNPVVNAYIEKEIFHVTDINKPIEKPTKKEEGFDEETGKKILTATLNEPHSFSEWLKLLSTQPDAVKPETREVKEKIQEQPTEKPEQEQHQVNDENKQKKQEIIDKIIKSNPGPTRITETTDFFSAGKTARTSNKEDETLVTETLAWIYEQQGNYPKAIKAYKMLSLKYPEKSVYFASLIQKIKLKQKHK